MRVVDLAEAIAPGAELLVTGIRPGEKLHEEMISSEDAQRPIRQEDRYIVMPTRADWGFHVPPGREVSEGFAHSSDTNDMWLTVDQLRTVIDSDA